MKKNSHNRMPVRTGIAAIAAGTLALTSCSTEAAPAPTTVTATVTVEKTVPPTEVSASTPVSSPSETGHETQSSMEELNSTAKLTAERLVRKFNGRESFSYVGAKDGDVGIAWASREDETGMSHVSLSYSPTGSYVGLDGDYWDSSTRSTEFISMLYNLPEDEALSARANSHDTFTMEELLAVVNRPTTELGNVTISSTGDSDTEFFKTLNKVGFGNGNYLIYSNVPNSDVKSNLIPEQETGTVFNSFVTDMDAFQR